MYKHIFVPVDLNEKGFADKAVAHALWLAKQSDAELHLLTVLPGVHMPIVSSYFPVDAARRMRQETQSQLNQFANQYVDGVTHHQYILEGKPWETIIKQAKKVNADLIVMPSHKRRKLDKVVLGSVASKVVENSPIDVVIIKPQTR